LLPEERGREEYVREKTSEGEAERNPLAYRKTRPSQYGEVTAVGVKAVDIAEEDATAK
jgi:hypothetical protein